MVTVGAGAGVAVMVTVGAGDGVTVGVALRDKKVIGALTMPSVPPYVDEPLTTKSTFVPLKSLFEQTCTETEPVFGPKKVVLPTSSLNLLVILILARRTLFVAE